MIKKIAFISLVTLIHSLKLSAQCGTDCVTRVGLGLSLYNNVFLNINPSTIPASNYPSPYLDLGISSQVDKKIKIVRYLDYGDGITALGHLGSNGYFFPNGVVNRYEGLVAIMEAWDIQPNDTGSVSYNDIDQSNPYFAYINEAENRGFLDGLFGSNFNGDFGMRVSEYNAIVSRISNSKFHPVHFPKLSNTNNYFLPNNFTPENMGVVRGLEQGIFSHYAKNSFVIPDRMMNLNFSHYYSTSMVELPQGYFPIQPLGRGWTHTYNAYIIREENVNNSNDDVYYIIWQDGTIHMYHDNDNKYLTKGVYDKLDEESGGDIVVITKKNQTKYTFERLDNDEPIFYLIEIEDRFGNDINIEYQTSKVDNNFERIKWVEAPSGKKLRFYYHQGTDLIDSITDPINRSIKFSYHSSYKRLKRFYDAKGQDTRYYYLAYDDDDPNDHEYKRYLMKRVRLPEGNSVKAEYDDNDNGKLRSYTVNNSEKVKVNLSINHGTNTPVSAILEVPMPNGKSQDFKYSFNKNGMLTSFNNDVNDISFNYPTSNNADNPLLPNSANLNGVDVTYRYDDRGNITQIQKGGITDDDFEYNNTNDLIWYRDSNDNSTSFNYRSDGVLISIEDALGNFSYFNHDNYGQLTSFTNQMGITVNYTYEEDGALSAVNAPEGLSSLFTYDGINRLLSKTINGQTSSYNYDLNDNVTSFNNIGGLTTSYSYDKNDNLTSIINANGVATVFTYNDKDLVETETFGSLKKTYQYNDDRTLNTYTKPSGNQITYDYTNDGLLNSVGTITDIDYNNRGLISRIYNHHGHYEFNYDGINRLQTVEDKFNHELIDYDYDFVGNVQEIDYPDKGVTMKVLYDYDKKNRMTRVRVRINGTYRTIAEYEYRKDDLLDRVDYGNGIYGSFRYDDAGRKVGLSYSIPTGVNSGTLLFSDQVELNPQGNILTKNLYYKADQEIRDFPIAPTSYTYNDNNHLTSVDGLDVNVNDDGNTTLQTKPSNAGSTNSTVLYQYDIDDRLIQSNTITGTESFPVTYHYDTYGNRIRKFEVNGISSQGQADITYTWDLVNNNVILEESNLNDDLYHVYGATGLEATINAQTGEIVTYYLGDLRGNVVVNVKEDTNNHQFSKYDDFGNLVYGSTTEPTEVFKFLGKYGITLENAETGHYYIKARHYDSQLGRFLTEDPIWNANLFSYTSNNPLNKIDVNGKSETAALISSIPQTIGSYYGLDNYFYENGYGDAANLLSQESGAWNYAISNPIKSGLIISGGLFITGLGLYHGLPIFSSLARNTGVGIPFAINKSTEGFFYLSGSIESLKLTSNLLGYLNDYNNGKNDAAYNISQTILNLYGPEFLDKDQQFYINLLNLLKK